MDFYLDDHDLITVAKSEKLAKGSLKVLLNGKDVSYSLANDEKHLFIKLACEYKDKDDLKVILNDEEQDLLYRFISHTKRFDREYETDLKKLGCFISEEGTIFRLWAPFSRKAFIVIMGKEKEMTYLGQGLYELKIAENLDGQHYHYKVLREKYYEFSDPFSYIDKDRNDSYVIDKRRLSKEKVKAAPFKGATIYEMSVRDFSSDERVPFKHPKKFSGLIEEGLKLDGERVGFDHLKDLGFTHYQLMPVFSFDLDGSDYNWGYNPLSFNSLERSYLCSDDPYEEIGELKRVVDVFHAHDMRITLDVVFNHVYRQKDFNLEKMLPYYFFRYDGDEVGNASLCGNETRSEGRFLREYLKLLCTRFIDIYDIDGLRFDIMGILDKRTINEIYVKCLKKKEDFIIYGEGWNMGDILPVEEKAIIENGKDLKHIGFFLDGFRNVFRGKLMEDEKAYLLGDVERREEVKEVLNASSYLGLEKDQALNYLECHDNYTLYDKLCEHVEKEEYRIKIAKLGMAVTVLSRGIPFIHSGQEFLRTKMGNDNSYNSGDKVNMMDWKRCVKYHDVSAYLRDLLRLRKEVALFDEEVVNIGFADYYEVLIFKLNDLHVFINPCIFDHIYEDDNEYDVIFDERGFTDHRCKAMKIPSFSVLVAYKR